MSGEILIGDTPDVYTCYFERNLVDFNYLESPSISFSIATCVDALMGAYFRSEVIRLTLKQKTVMVSGTFFVSEFLIIGENEFSVTVERVVLSSGDEIAQARQRMARVELQGVPT